MRHASIPLAAATSIFMLGVFIINLQVWYSARADSLAEARYVVRDLNTMLKEARHATQLAMQLADNEYASVTLYHIISGYL